MNRFIGLAVTAARDNLRSHLFSAIALAAVLAPLLILYGLKLGIINGMIDDLRRDPNVLQVGISGNRPLNEAELSALRARPETGFVVGAPRSIAARAEMRATAESMSFVNADWLPSGDGDPLLVERVDGIGNDEIVLSDQLGRALDTDIGGTVVAAVYRNDQSEIYEMTLRVVDILPPARLAGMRALVTGTRINAISAFSDNFAVPEAGIAGRPLSERTTAYDSLRLYAASLDTVEGLEDIVSGMGFRTSSQAANIEWIRSLESAMTGVFAIISMAGLLGYALSLWAVIAANVRHARPEFSLMRLIGMSQRDLWVFPIVQVLCITTIGVGLAILLAIAAAAAINHIFLTDAFGDALCQIRGQEVLVAIIASTFLALLVATQQLFVLQSTEPSDALAETI